MTIAIMLLVLAIILFVAILIGLAKLFKKGYFGTIFVIVLTPIVAYEVFQYHWFSQVIPKQLEITYPISIGEESGFREGCGAAVYKLSDKTIEKIQKNGLKFFEGARQGRGYQFDNYYTYEAWKVTPVPKGWVSEGSWIPCGTIRESVHREIILAAKRPGSFYTTKHEGKLVVIPSLGCVVFSFFG